MFSQNLIVKEQITYSLGLMAKKVDEAQTGLSYTFDNLDRDSHILALSVVDKKGKVLITSNQFYSMYIENLPQKIDSQLSLKPSPLSYVATS